MNLDIKKIKDNIHSKQVQTILVGVGTIVTLIQSLGSWDYIVKEDLNMWVNIGVPFLGLLALLFFLWKLSNDNSSEEQYLSLTDEFTDEQGNLDRDRFKTSLYDKNSSNNESEGNKKSDEDIFKNCFNKILNNPSDDPSSEIILDILHTLSEEAANESKSLDELIYITHHDKNDIIESVKLLKDKGFIINQIILDEKGNPKQLDPKEWKLRHSELNNDIHTYTDRYVSLVKKDNIKYFIDLDVKHTKQLKDLREYPKWPAVIFWLVILVCTYRLINPTVQWNIDHKGVIGFDFDYWYILVCHGLWAYYVTLYYKNYFHKAAKIYGNPQNFEIANALMILIVFAPMLYTAFYDRSFWIWTVVIGGMGVALNLFFFQWMYIKGAEFKKRIWDQAKESMVNMLIVAFVALSMGTMITPSLNFYEFSAKFLTDDNRKQIIRSLVERTKIEVQTDDIIANKPDWPWWEIPRKINEEGNSKKRDEFLKKLSEKLQERDRVNNIEAITEALKAALTLNINIDEERKNFVGKKLINKVNGIDEEVSDTLTKTLIKSLSDKEFLIATGLEDTLVKKQVKKLQDVLTTLSTKLKKENIIAFNNKPTYYLDGGKHLDLWLAVLLSIFALFAINWHAKRKIVSARLGSTSKDFLKDKLQNK